MIAPPTLSIEFETSLPPDVVDRVDHAFSSFCAHFGYRRVGPDCSADLELAYGGPRPDALPVATWRPAPRRARDRLPTYYGSVHGRIDHLAEIHAWLAAVSEVDAPQHDSVGRVAFESTMPGHLGVDPTVAWASRHMAAFNDLLSQRLPRLPDRPLELPGVQPGRLWVGASHDLDFIPLARTDVVERVLRNIGVAAFAMRDPGLTASIIASILRSVARGVSTLGGVEVAHALEAGHGVRSSWNVITARRHRRDGNYDAKDLRVESLLHRLAAQGHEVGVHGSYTSAERAGALASEYEQLRHLGFEPCGGRQHWLRHDGPTLYAELEKAGARYDSTGGFPDRTGFRHGMASPFVPFDLNSRRPARVIEIPLVLMDVALSGRARDGVSAEAEATRVLAEARSHQGAVSVLWHDTVFGGAQVRAGIDTLYETLIEIGDRWTPLNEIADAMVDRCARAGLSVG